MGRRYSRSPSPIGYRRGDRSSSPRDHHYRSRGRDLPTSLLVRNLRYDCRQTSSPIGDYRSRRSYSRSPDYCSPSQRRRHYSRSISPGNRRYKRGRSYSRSPRSGSWSRSSSPY